MKFFRSLLLAAILSVSLLAFIPQQARAADTASTAENTVNIYLFWGQGCPHCAKAKPFLEDLADSSNKISLYKYEIYYNAVNQQLFGDVGEALDIDSSGVPLIVIGDKAFVGYSEASADIIESRALECTEKACPDSVADIVGVDAPQSSINITQNSSTSSSGESSSSEKDENETINLPLVGEIRTANLSLPVLTILIGALDGFNPCAMWVLIFLITVLLGMHNRKRMLALGSSFIIASAFVYFMFMTAWLNIFMFIGYVSWIKVLIGLFALGVGTYYLYDFHNNRSGSCKVTGGGKRQEIFEKIRRITHEKSFWIALVGIISLAFAVNLIELVCSAGLPAIYTSVLAGADLPTWQYYMYLGLYILVFMADDLFVFLAAMFTLKVTGLQSQYARFAHLIGGILMLILGILLLFAPQLLMFG